MPQLFLYSFKHVVLMDSQEKSISTTSCNLNLKNTLYTKNEAEELPSSYKSALIHNMISEFEIVLLQRSDLKKLDVNSVYTVNIFDRKIGATTNFSGLVVKLERTHKEKDGLNRYFYTGVRINDVGYDGLHLFSFYTPKIIVAFDKNTGEAAVCRTTSEQKENGFVNDKKYENHKFYNISEYVESKKYNSAAGAVIPMERFA
jgi:hypothetical protein